MALIVWRIFGVVIHLYVKIEFNAVFIANKPNNKR
jgi:hypothetical protein